MDIKTSTKGWDDKTKKDETKQLQLVLYKKYYSQQFGVPEDDIEIEKVHKIREPVRDQPCKPNFLEYTGKGWPQCGEPVMYHAPKWPKKI